MADKKTEVNNEDLLNIYDDSQDSADLFATESNGNETKESKPTIKIDEDIFDEIKIEEPISISKDNETISTIDIVEPIIEIKEEGESEGFMDEIGDLKEEGEKKSFFGSFFKKKEKQGEDINPEETKEESLNNELIASTDSVEEEIKEEGEKKSFFGNLLKKKRENKEKDEDINNDIKKEDSSNIFDDFNQDDSLLDEVEQLKNEIDKDIYFYVDKTASVLQVIFIIGLLLLTVTYGYIFLQEKVYEYDKKDNQILEPICFMLLDDIHYNGTFCTSISTLELDYINELEELKTNQISEIMGILQRLYKIENFTKTKDVVFLKDKTKDKLPILGILSEFDELKNEFDKVDKDKIQCSSINIDQSTKMISMNCVAYSAGYESGIRGFDGKNETNSLLKGTSISIANSFLNFIHIESKIFTIIDRQKIFKSDSVVGVKTGFTNKTSFNLKLKYNLD